MPIFNSYTFLVSVLALCPLFALAETVDTNAWLDDYSTMKQALQQRYSNLTWFASVEGGIDLPELDRQTLIGLKAATRDQDARDIMRNFVRSFHDGHFYMIKAPKLPPPAPDESSALKFSRNDAEGGCRALNYKPVRDSALSLPFDSLTGFGVISDGTGLPFRAGILTIGSPELSIGIVRIPEFTSNHLAFCLEAWRQNEVWDSDGKFIYKKFESLVRNLWYTGLVELLNKFKTAKVAAVLVDIGHNYGGDDSGDIAARLFTNIPLYSSSLWMSQDTEASSPYFDEVIGTLKYTLELNPSSHELKQSLSYFIEQKEKLSQSCALDWVWHERRAWGSDSCQRLVEAGSAGGPLAYLEPDTIPNEDLARSLHWPLLVKSMWGTWTGALYVLTDQKTYSSAEMFAATLQNNGAAKIIGNRTGGSGCGAMNLTKPLVLPHSGLRFNVPNCVRMRADGTNEVAGVSPDIPILLGEDDSPTKKAQRTVEELYGDLTRGSARR